MPAEFLDSGAKRALSDAVKAIESNCSAEIVIAVRARSGSYWHASVLVGVVAAFIAQAVALYSSIEFSLLSILLEPFGAGLLIGLLASRAPMLDRWLTPRSIRRKHVLRAAKATFFDKGVRHTRASTGILVYISLVERMAEFVIDSGVEQAIPRTGWDTVVAQVDACVRTGGDGAAVAKALHGLCDVLGPVLTRAADDVNELPDEVCA